mgnify:CR=1 FL=1
MIAGTNENYLGSGEQVDVWRRRLPLASLGLSFKLFRSWMKEPCALTLNPCKHTLGRHLKRQLRLIAQPKLPGLLRLTMVIRDQDASAELKRSLARRISALVAGARSNKKTDQRETPTPIEATSH